MIAVIYQLLAFAIFCGAAYLLAHRLLPWAVVRLGRALGYRMKLTPLTERRVRRFKSIRRGYWCFVIVTTAFTLSLFLELFMNHRALWIRFGDDVKTPALNEWLNAWVPFVTLNEQARDRDFGLPGDAEVDYRSYARWADRPEALTEEADALIARIERDVAEIGLPLPPAKAAEHAALRERAERLRALRPAFEEGRAGIVMPIYPYSPREQLLHLEGSPPHPMFRAGGPVLGTDFEGKDVLSQLFYGFRVGFSFAVLVVAAGFTIGIAVGAVMGYFGGWVDIVTQRVIEVASNIPFLYVLMIIGSIVTKMTFPMLLVLFVVLNAWIGITYTIRGEFYREKARDYVAAARAIGVRSTTIMSRHILPNSLVPVVTYAPFSVVAYTASLVALEFLGLGLPPGTPSWGRLLRQGADNIANHPQLIYFPVLAFAGTLFCVVMVGEAVREAFDPKKYSRLR